MSTETVRRSKGRCVHGGCFIVSTAAHKLVRREQGWPSCWPTWFTVLCAIGSLTPILGAFSLTGPLNVGNGWIGIHAVAASWVVWTGVASLYFLYEKRKGNEGKAVVVGAT